MSSSLLETGMYITRYTLPFIYVAGIVANILNLIILRRQTMKQNSCVLYFFILSMSNLIYIIICMTPNLFSDGFGIRLTQNNNIFCKINTYLLNFCPLLSVYMLILASIDRYFSSSLDQQRRMLSNTRMAQRSIIVALLFNIIFLLDNAIVVSTKNSPIGLCATSTNNNFDRFIITTQVIIYVLVGPFLMILFGLLTIHNIYRLNGNHVLINGYRPSERQLTRMLLAQVLTHVIFSLPFCIIYFMTIIPTSFKATIMFPFLFIIFKLPFYLTFITPFFLHILTAQIYRREFFLLLNQIIRYRRNTVIYPTGIQLRTTERDRTN